MPAPQPRPRVLLVDDDQTIRLTLGQILEGFDLTLAASVASAHAAIARSSFDVAVLDYQLPDGNGHMIARSLRSRCPHASVIMLTAHRHYGAVRDLESSGELMVLFKPADPETVLSWVENEVRLHTMRKRISEGDSGQWMQTATGRWVPVVKKPGTA